MCIAMALINGSRKRKKLACDNFQPSRKEYGKEHHDPFTGTYIPVEHRFVA
jgi:hypothetical protein